jgi:hypothetical protein
MYYPGLAPVDGDLDSLRAYVQTELEQLSGILQVLMSQQLQLVERHVLPAKPREGVIVFADGTDWNPGAGRGVYVFSSGSWVKL